MCLLPSHRSPGALRVESLILFLFVPWPFPLDLHGESLSTEPVESQKAMRGVSPACEPPIEREGTPVAAREIAILGSSELAIRTSVLKVAAIYHRGEGTSDVFFLTTFITDAQPETQGKQGCVLTSNLSF